MPAGLRVGYPTEHACAAGKMLPAYQALRELAQAELGSFVTTSDGLTFYRISNGAPGHCYTDDGDPFYES